MVREGESKVTPTLLFGETGWMLGILPDDKETLEEGLIIRSHKGSGAGLALSFLSRRSVQDTWPRGTVGRRLLLL